VRAPDIGGSASTKALGAAIASRVNKRHSTSSPPQAARIPTASRFVSRDGFGGFLPQPPTSAEDHEEALLLGCPPIDRSDRRNIEQFARKRKRGLRSSA